MKTLSHLPIAVVISALLVAQVGADDAKSVRLFDGKTLAGWEGNLKMFRVQDGAIVAGSLEKKIPHNEFLCTKKQYGDFELRLKCKIRPATTNAGIQFRSARIPNHHEVKGYQADIGKGWWGKLYDESRRRKVLAGPKDDKLEETLRDGQWNEYVIRCQGRRIRLWVNGRQTVDYTEPDPSLPTKGIIGLQIHGGPPAEAWYKDIVIEEL